MPLIHSEHPRLVLGGASFWHCEKSTTFALRGPTTGVFVAVAVPGPRTGVLLALAAGEVGAGTFVWMGTGCGSTVEGGWLVGSLLGVGSRVPKTGRGGTGVVIPPGRGGLVSGGEMVSPADDRESLGTGTATATGSLGDARACGSTSGEPPTWAKPTAPVTESTATTALQRNALYMKPLIRNLLLYKSVLDSTNLYMDMARPARAKKVPRHEKHTYQGNEYQSGLGVA